MGIVSPSRVHLHRSLNFYLADIREV
ncbi:hypothetical protein MHPYR_480045 [uncultured Mycobacterium sp.]|uniref:Uncharacterized protein n=1 Tax=uncultured Mycobacterium sp. TaxID=171292 RepID=A0A1Y5PPE8_9MYCO|nr:hypothetical protein MHPYR_480045 [uncultured Mycobacterium sp.]